MVRNNTTLVALCVIAFFQAFGSVNAQPTVITQAILDVWFNNNGNTYTFDDRVNGYWVQGNIEIPSDNVNANQDEVFTVAFEPSAQVSFSLDDQGNAGGSLTMRVNEDGGIGCIQVLGIEEAMVTMDEAVEEAGWGGINILTEPEGENIIEYCEIAHANVPGLFASIYINEDAQVEISNSLIRDNPNEENGRGIGSIRGLYSIKSNEITGCFSGIRLTDPIQSEDEEVLRAAVINNIIHDNDGIGIEVVDGWQGWILNNIVYNNGDDEIVVAQSEDANIVNNTIDDLAFTDDGIDCQGNWPTRVLNNIIANCNVGIRGTDDEDEFDYCLLFDNNTQFDDCSPADNGANCIIGDGNDENPDFVDEPIFDFHLFWTSPAINTGVPDEDYDDPDDSRNDIGAFGGPGASDFEIYDGDYGDYCVIDEEFWEAPVGNEIELPRDTYRVLQDISVLDDITIEEGTHLQFAQNVDLGILVGMDAVIGEQGGDMVVFEPIPDTDPITTWSGIWAEDFNQIELYNCEITGVSNTALPALALSEAHDAIIQGCHIHDNQAQGGVYIWFSEVILGGDPDEGEGNEINDNDEYGLCIDDCDIGDVYILGNNIHDNGLDDDDNVMLCGLQIIDSEPSFLLEPTTLAEGLNYIYNNSVTGVYCYGSEPLWEHEAHATADVIAGNGRQFEEQEDEWGAEVYYLAPNMILSFENCDIYDEIIGVLQLERLGILLYCGDSQSSIVADNCFISGDPEEPTGGDDFNGAVTFGVALDDPLDEDFYDEMTIASVDAFDLAWGSFCEAEYEDCISYCRRYIATESNGKNAGQALKLWKACLLRTNADLSNFREYCLDLADEQAETVVGCAARWLSIDCLTSEGNYQAAREEYENIVENAEREGDAVFANLRLLYLEKRENRNHIDSDGSWLKRRNELLKNAHKNTRNNNFDATVAKSPTLEAAYPNPFNSMTSISYVLPEAARVNLSILDLQGREVAVLHDGELNAGSHTSFWDASSLSSGIYLCRLEAAGKHSTVKLTLIK